MGSLTDGAIRQALKRVEQTGKQENLTDGEGRGTGRLVLIVRAMPKRDRRLDGAAVAGRQADQEEARRLPVDVARPGARGVQA